MAFMHTQTHTTAHTHTYTPAWDQSFTYCEQGPQVGPSCTSFAVIGVDPERGLKGGVSGRGLSHRAVRKNSKIACKCLGMSGDIGRVGRVGRVESNC